MKEFRMNQDLVPVIGWGAVALAVLIALIAYKKVLRLFGLFIVPEDSASEPDDKCASASEIIQHFLILLGKRPLMALVDADHGEARYAGAGVSALHVPRPCDPTAGERGHLGRIHFDLIFREISGVLAFPSCWHGPCPLGYNAMN